MLQLCAASVCRTRGGGGGGGKVPDASLPRQNRCRIPVHHCDKLTPATPSAVGSADGSLIDELPHSIHKVDTGKGAKGGEAKGDFWCAR